MIYNGKEIEFPAIMQVSFFKLIEQLETQRKSKDKAQANYAQELLKVVEEYPELRDGITDITQLKDYKEPMGKLVKPLFPEVLMSNEIKILTPPFYFDPIYTSSRFDKIVAASGKPFSFNMKDIDEDAFYLYCCCFILGNYFDYPAAGFNPQFFEIENKEQGIRRVYKLLINADMADFIPTDKAVQITREDYEELIENFDDLSLWKKKFPPNSWIMKGVNILNLIDVTADQAINSVKSNLLLVQSDTFEKVKWGIRKLLNNPDLAIGVVSVDNDYMVRMKDKSIESLILKEGDKLDCRSGLCENMLTQLIKNKIPLAIPNAKKYHARNPCDFSQKLIKSGYKSYIIAPTVYEGELLGFMELGAKNSYELHRGSISLLDQVIPILSMAKKRFQTEVQNLLEAIIQQECTTIHSSVKWKFEEQAKKFMERQLAGEQPVFEDVVFDQLYPLYGQLDIKGSSGRRNKAVSIDLIKQLKGVLKVLKLAFKKQPIPIYDELIFRINEFIEEINSDLTAGSEHRILTFLKKEVYAVFDYLKKSDGEISKKIGQYYDLLDPDTQTVYQERKKYDTSVNRINQLLASFLDSKQIEAQAMFPHYFERYKTDGVEFNMYIGQSITNQKDFDIVFVRNLRLWQLLTMCEMENEFQALKKEIETPIEIASLILVYNAAIAVHFRMDEKKFDVEGAYNARYEIIKKRVDKAHIKGTNDRITRPGSIVIVYAQESDAQEYRIYLKYLVGKGYLKEEVEDFQLEDLQGIHGLRALRVDVNYTEGTLTVDEFIEEMEKV